MDLHVKYRPKYLKDVIGQAETVKSLQGYLKREEVPHAILFHGESGCGKTSIARALGREMGCDNRSDFQEINAASSRGIDTIRDIQSHINQAPIKSPCRIWLLDEAHQLTRKKGGDAQTALLKTLEEPPNHSYIWLCSTEPDDLLKTIRGRCTGFKINRVKPKEMHSLLTRTLCHEYGAEGNGYLVSEVIEKIVDVADGCPREALVILSKVLNSNNEEEQLAIIEKTGTKHVAFDIVKALLWERPKWNTLAAIIKEVDDEPENIRRLVMAVAETEILKGGKNVERCFLILSVFEDPIFDTGRSGRAKLTRMLFEVFSNAKK